MQDAIVNLTSIFVYLGEEPLLWLTLTIGAFIAARALFEHANRFPLLNPVLVASMAICLVLYSTNTTYAAYFKGAQFIHFLLGPAIIVLAVPVWRYRAALWRARYAVLAALVAGALPLASVPQRWRVIWLDNAMIAAIAPKSVTAPVAMGMAKALAGRYLCPPCWRY